MFTGSITFNVYRQYFIRCLRVVLHSTLQAVLHSVFTGSITFSVYRQYYIQRLQAVLHSAFTGSNTFIFTGSITFSFYRQSLFTVGILAERCRDVRDCTITTCPSNSTHIACHAERCTCDAVICKIQPPPLPPRTGFLNIFSNKILLSYPRRY